MIVYAAARVTELTGQENNPFALWGNQAATATLSGTTTLADGSRQNAVTGTTYSYWLPDVSGTTASFIIQMPVAIALTAAAIAVHNVGTLGATARIRKSADGITYADAGAGPVTPTDDEPILWRMEAAATAVAWWELRIEGLTAGDPLAVAVVFFGSELIFPVRFYQGFSPPITPNQVQLQSNVSIGGNLMGNSVVQTGTKLRADFEHVPATFVRGDMKLFAKHFNRGKGFFFAWRPTKYVSDLRYCWRDGEVIDPENTGPSDMMGFQIQMRAHEEVDE